MAEWANISYNGESVGTLYVEDDGFGFVPVVQSASAAPGFGVISNLIKSALIAELPAVDAYFGILGVLDKRSEFSYESGNGELEKPERDDSGLIAAAVEDAVSPYYVTMQDDGTIINLFQETGDEPLVRENGEWVEFSDDTDGDEDGEGFEYVTEKSVITYDKMVSSNEAPTINDLEVVPFE